MVEELIHAKLPVLGKLARAHPFDLLRVAFCNNFCTCLTAMEEKGKTHLYLPLERSTQQQPRKGPFWPPKSQYCGLNKQAMTTSKMRSLQALRLSPENSEDSSSAFGALFGFHYKMKSTLKIGSHFSDCEWREKGN